MNEKDGINFEEWMQEIERCRPLRHYNAATFLPEHDRAILAARDRTPKVTWTRLSQLAAEWGWPASSKGALGARYRQLKDMQKK